MIDLAPEQLAIVRRLLSAHVPECEVRAFGSRVAWTAKAHSDLDLALVGSDKLPSSKLRRLREAFEESGLAVRVDLLDWHSISENFRSVIAGRYEVLQKAANVNPGRAQWEILPLGELTENLDGRRVPVKELDRKPGPYPYYGASGIVDRVDGYLFDGEYLLIGEDGENLRTRQTPIAFMAKGKFWVNNHAHIVRGNHRADTRFLSYVLSQTDISGYLTGSTMPKLTQGNLNRLPVVVPPLAEQKAIAAVLGALDDKIELNRRMNATLEAMARALFQSWFIDFDPVRANLDRNQPSPQPSPTGRGGKDREKAKLSSPHGRRAGDEGAFGFLDGRPPAALDPATAALFPDSFQDSPLGHIPTGWEVIPLYDTAQWVNGAAFKNEDFSVAGEGLPVIKIAELKAGISDQTKWCQRDAGADKIIDTGDLVYSWSGSPDTSLEAFLWSGGRGLLNQHIFKVISATVAEKRFVYYLLQYLRPVLVETARNKQTTGLGHVTIADMKRMLVCMPSKAMLAAFDRNVAPIFDKAFTNTLESRTLATLRDTLLPKLLSGELSVAAVVTSSPATPP